MRLKSLYKYTEKLPFCKPNQTDKLIGTSTEESILSGVINGTIAEIDGIISQYKDIYNPLKIILSGGDAIYFDKKLKNSIFAVSNIVFFGLNEILDYNVK
jgi:type III pantothenate kinase